MKACASLSGLTKACFDFSFAISCMTDANCPQSPSGQSGTCLDQDNGLSPGDALYHKCYFPYSANENKFMCW
jgi:hypothetical protein